MLPLPEARDVAGTLSPTAELPLADVSVSSSTTIGSIALTHCSWIHWFMCDSVCMPVGRSLEKLCDRVLLRMFDCIFCCK